MIENALSRLQDVFAGFESAGVAVSGGIDSMVLAHLAHHWYGDDMEVFHAASPAVPMGALGRIERHARVHGWRLTVVDAGELNDPEYRRNPLNRCYFCKRALFTRLRQATAAQLMTGANLDDVDDFRPGLAAAREFSVVHPYVEAEINKRDIRSLASMLDLRDLADTPALPCLSSRVETGIPINPGDLETIDRIESFLRAIRGPGTLRCRIRRSGVVIELDSLSLDRLSEDERNRIDSTMHAVCTAWQRPWVGIRPYRRGSAFVGGSSVEH